MSLLTELCQQSGLEPMFTVIGMEGLGHEPKFTYEVRVVRPGVPPFVATGSAASKQLAKHRAANEILKKITSSEYCNSFNKISQTLRLWDPSDFEEKAYVFVDCYSTVLTQFSVSQSYKLRNGNKKRRFRKDCLGRQFDFQTW